MFIPIKYISEYKPEQNKSFFDSVINMNIFVAASFFYETSNIDTAGEEDINNVKEHVETLLGIKNTSLYIYTKEGMNKYNNLFSPYVGTDPNTGKRNIFATVTNDEIFSLRDKPILLDGRKFESKFEDVRRFFFDCAIRSIYGAISPQTTKEIITHRETIYSRMVGLTPPQKGTYLDSIYRKKYTLQKYIKETNEDNTNPFFISTRYIGDKKRAYIITRKTEEEPDLFSQS